MSSKDPLGKVGKLRQRSNDANQEQIDNDIIKNAVEITSILEASAAPVRKNTKKANTNNRKSIKAASVMLRREDWVKLVSLKTTDGTTQQDAFIKGLSLVFAEYGLPPAISPTTVNKQESTAD